MNKSSKIRPLHSFETLQFVLEFYSLIKSLFRVAFSPDPTYGFLEFKSDLRLFLLQYEIRQALCEYGNCLFGGAIPFKRLSPSRIRRACVGICGAFKYLLTPKGKSWVCVHNHNANVMRGMNSVEMLSELFMGVDVNHTLTVNESCKAGIVQFCRHGRSIQNSILVDNLISFKEHVNG